MKMRLIWVKHAPRKDGMSSMWFIVPEFWLAVLPGLTVKVNISTDGMEVFLFAQRLAVVQIYALVLYMPAILPSLYRWLTRYANGALQCKVCEKRSHGVPWCSLALIWGQVGPCWRFLASSGNGSWRCRDFRSFLPTFTSSVQFGLVASLLSTSPVTRSVPLCSGLIWPAIEQTTSSVQDSNVSWVLGKMDCLNLCQQNATKQQRSLFYHQKLLRVAQPSHHLWHYWAWYTLTKKKKRVLICNLDLSLSLGWYSCILHL